MLVVEHDMAFVRQIAQAGDRAAFRARVRPGRHRRDHRRPARRAKSTWARAMRLNPLLEVAGLRAGYGATPILQGVDMTSARARS